MLDPKLIRQNIDAVAKALQDRGFEMDVEHITLLEAERKTLQVKVQELQNERNTLSKEVGQAKARGESGNTIKQRVKEIAETLSTCAEDLALIQGKLEEYLSYLPNIPHSSVPIGKTEAENKVVRTWGEPPKFNFVPKDHVDLGLPLGLDFVTASKLTGARFVVMRGFIATLHRALTQFMLDLHSKVHGYEEIYVPYIVNHDTLYGTGQLPKLKEDLFALKGEHEYYLIPTSESPVTNTVRDEIIEIDRLPIKYVCHSPCFRSEAGSYGKDTRGMIRQHQFEKVELVHIVHPDQSYAALEELTQHAENVLKKLELPYRVSALCTGDLGFYAAKTYDLEVWLPGQNCYREISSCSNTESFQARRMKARFKDPKAQKIDFVHTLNGSGLAVGRTLVALLENYQNEDGQIRIPEALQPYLK